MNAFIDHLKPYVAHIVFSIRSSMYVYRLVNFHPGGRAERGDAGVAS